MKRFSGVNSFALLRSRRYAIINKVAVTNRDGYYCPRSEAKGRMQQGETIGTVPFVSLPFVS